jgi:hypothetical protein
MRRPRRNHLPAFKAKVALAALEGNATLAEGCYADVPVSARSARRGRSLR